MLAQSPIDVYLSAIEHPIARANLTRLRGQLRRLLPKAEETISYQMPAFRLPTGEVVAGFAFFGKHCGYYPHSGRVVATLGALTEGFKTTRGGLTFAPEKRLPLKLVQALVKARLAELRATVPPRGPLRRRAR